MIGLGRIVGWDHIVCLPILAGDVEHDLRCIDFLLTEPSAAWAHPVLAGRRDALVAMLER